MQTKALRVAAYFLIAHYSIVTALALLGKGTPDYFKIAITLGILVAAVAVLFRPRKQGWWMVVAYAWFAANPFVQGTWVVWVSPELPSSAKITASIVMALINSPLIVALVLVFMPASFASFTTPTDNAAAQAAKPAGVAGDRTHVLGWMVAIAIVAVAVAALLTVNAYRTGPGSQWMTSAQYQREFDTRAQKGFYPHEVEGECQSDGDKFRADWKPIPSGASFFAHHGMTRQDYDRRNQEYPSKGYALGSVRHFKDCSGLDRYQATWLRR
jgi:polyglycine hydrolase-like protein